MKLQQIVKVRISIKVFGVKKHSDVNLRKHGGVWYIVLFNTVHEATRCTMNCSTSCSVIYCVAAETLHIVY